MVIKKTAFVNYTLGEKADAFDSGKILTVRLSAQEYKDLIFMFLTFCPGLKFNTSPLKILYSPGFYFYYPGNLRSIFLIDGLFWIDLTPFFFPGIYSLLSGKKKK